MQKTYIVGASMTRFERPMSRDWDVADMASAAVKGALADSGLAASDIQTAVVGHVLGESTSGQRGVYEGLGTTGIPVINVNNNCSTGSTALFVARRFASTVDGCVLALGFECMEKNLSQVYVDKGRWTAPTSKHWDQMYTLGDKPSNASLDTSRALSNPKYNAFTDNIIKLFAYAGREHSAKYGTTKEQFAKVAYKNHRHSKNNPFAALQKEFPLEAMESMPLLEPITMLQACPTGDGAAAVIVASEAFVEAHNLWHMAVEIAGQALVTDLPSSFSDPKPPSPDSVAGGFISLSGVDMAAEAARRAYKEAGVDPKKDVSVAEVHDCFSVNELMMYEALGLCGEGEGGKMIDSAEWRSNSDGGDLCWLDGRVVVNASGGLLSKGHPIGATGLGQCCELTWQLRGVAGARQVTGARTAVQHNFGMGGAAVVTVYKRPLKAIVAAAKTKVPGPVVPPRAPPRVRSRL